MFQKTTLPLHAAPSEASSSRQRSNLTLEDIQSDSISKLAEKHFGKWDPKVVDTIFEQELVQSKLSSHKLTLLEYSQYLEKVICGFYSTSPQKISAN
jgi:hypothetical protein